MLLLKATLVLALAPIAALALRRAPASTRHRLWSWTFAALLALPVLGVTLPPLNVPLPGGMASTLALSPPAVTPPSTAVAAVPETMPASAMPEPEPIVVAMSPTRQLTPIEIVGSLWLAGSLLSLLTLIVSVLRVHWLSKSAGPLEDPGWSDAMTSIAQRLALRLPVSLRISPRVATPMAGGFLRPTVFLPSSAVQWDAERRDVVLAHELSHLAARDPQRHVLARLALALYWFHPLAWFAARQSTAAREAACDERVLSLGTRPSAYARVLLDLAESMQRSPAALATLPMVHKSSLEVRVMTILNGTVRPSSTFRGTVAVLALTLGTLVVAAGAPRDAEPGSTARWVDNSPVPIVSPAPVSPAGGPVTAAPRLNTQRREECLSGHEGESFSGTINTSGRNGINVIYEQVGTLNRINRIVLFPVDGIRLCMFGENVGPASNDLPSTWIGKADRVVMESSGGGASQRLVVERGTAPQTVWQVNGVTRPIDRAATEWRDRMLAMFDAHWELTTLRGQVTTLRGQITSLRGQETSLRGQITSLQGEVTSMRGRITSLRGEETSMRGRITSIRGQETSLRGQITSARGAITSIVGSSDRPSDADRRVAEYVRQIERIEREIRDYNADAKVATVEKEITQFDADRKIAEIEKQIDQFDLEKKVADVERRIAELNVDEKERELEREIDKIDVEKRAAEIQRRIDAERPRLKAAIAAIR